MAVTGSGGATFQWRSAADRPAANTDGLLSSEPHWVKLSRSGNGFTGYISRDGKVWREVGSVTVPMNKTITVGLGLSGHNSSSLNSTLFDNVSVKM